MMKNSVMAFFVLIFVFFSFKAYESYAAFNCLTLTPSASASDKEFCRAELVQIEAQLQELLDKEKEQKKQTGTLTGDGNFHIIPLMDFSRGDTAQIIMELGEKVYDLVLKYQGSITAEHKDGIIRPP